MTGLASGLNTDQIIYEEMAIYQQPVTNLQNQQSGLTAMNKQLTSIQSELQTLSADALAVGDPTLFMTQQSVTSSDTTRVSATSATGAGVGGYQVAVTQLANSAQATYGYTSPTSDDNVTVDGNPYTITAGESIQDFVDSINSDQNGTRLRRGHQLGHRGVLLPRRRVPARAARSPTAAARSHRSPPSPGRTRCSASTGSAAAPPPTPSPTRSAA